MTACMRAFLDPEELEEDNAMTVQFKELCAKALVLHEVCLVALTLEQRAFVTVPCSEWALFEPGEGYVQTFLDSHYFSKTIEAMSALDTASLPADACQDLTDFFDGRVYRHVLAHLIRSEKGGKVEAA